MKNELPSFINNLSVIAPYNHQELILIDKNTPRIYRIPKQAYLDIKTRKKNYHFTSALNKEYSLLRRWKYLPETKKIAAYNGLAPAVLSLRVSENCNLDCHYCFNKENMLNRKKIKYMSAQIAKIAVEYFIKRFPNKEKVIIFFGGEPLLNFPVIKETIHYVKKNFGEKIAFDILTNGTIMNSDILDAIIKNNIRIMVTLDFPPSEHIRNRPFKNGKASFNRIKENLILLTQSVPQDNLLVKSVVAKDSKFSPRYAYKSFSCSGIPTKNFVLNYEIINTADKNLLQFQRMEKFENQQKLFLKPFRYRLINRAKTDIYKKEIIGDLLSVIVMGRESLGDCPAANDAITVNPIGEIYFCDVVVNLSEFYLGNIDTGIDKMKLAKVRKNYSADDKECLTCWANSFCHHFCHLLHHNKVALRKNCARLKNNFIKELKFFLSLNYRQKENLIQSSLTVIDEKKYVDKQTQNLKVCLAINRMLNQVNKYIRPINILPY